MPVIASGARRAVLLSLLAVRRRVRPALAADAYPDKPIRLIVPYPRRRHRRDRPRAGPGADRRAGTDGGRGEPRGRGRQYRRRSGRQGAGRRLHPADGRTDQPFDQCRPVSRPRHLRRREELRAGVHRRHRAAGVRGQSFRAGHQPVAADRPGQVRRATSPWARPATARPSTWPARCSPRRRRGHPARAVQGQRPGHDRPDGRPGAEHDRNRARRPGQHQGRQAARAGGDLGRARAGSARHAHRRRGRAQDFEVSSMFGIVAPAGTRRRSSSV